MVIRILSSGESISRISLIETSQFTLAFCKARIPVDPAVSRTTPRKTFLTISADLVSVNRADQPSNRRTALPSVFRSIFGAISAAFPDSAASTPE